jgi:hypothetical protein
MSLGSQGTRQGRSEGRTKVQLQLRMCQAPWTSNRPQGSAYDKGLCTEEPRDRETVTRSSEVEAGTERPLPTITYPLGGYTTKQHITVA